MNTNDELEKAVSDLLDELHQSTSHTVAHSLVMAFGQRVRDDERAAEWSDKRDKWSDAIDAAHPALTDNNAHEIYQTALEMVGNRHGKYELVSLTHWLLTRIAELEAAQNSKEVMNNEPHNRLPVQPMPEQAVAVTTGACASEQNTQEISADESAKRIAEIREREIKATPGPWETRFIYRVIAHAKSNPTFLMIGTPSDDWANADLMAHSRADIPYLLSRVEELKAERKNLADAQGDIAEEVKDNQQLREHIKSLEAKLAEARGYLALYEQSDSLVSGQPDGIKKLSDLQSELSTLRRQVEEARTLLKPFALCADISSRIASIPPDKHWLWKPSSNTEELPGISVAHCDAAKSFLQQLAPGKEKE